MKRNIKSTASVALTAVFCTAVMYLHSPSGRNHADAVTLMNITALSDDNESKNKPEFECTGNTCTCVKGENFKIHGHLHLH